jgi:ABC-type multidrug transport system fused ATPase/permease subunit
LIDDLDLREIRLESWRRQIGFVAQDPFITHASIAQNILFGRSGVDFASLRRAAQIAHADEFISSLPEGYETAVGERGMKLSGGQQQRICIARAILHDPEILIFDEATSFLDVESERLIQEAIEQLSKDRTVVLVAHRLSTVRNADKILLLDEGRVVEEGSHLELIQAKGRYFRWIASGNPPGELEPVGGSKR